MAVPPVDKHTVSPPPPCGEGSKTSPQSSSSGHMQTMSGSQSEAEHRPDLVRSFLKGIASTARLMVGVPDYDAYVAHRKAMQPDEPVMTYEAFFRERQDSRYGVNGGKISRCC